MTQQIGTFLAGALLAFWFFFFMALSWEPEKSRLVNILMGIFGFVLAGAAYILPFWLLWKG